MKIILLQDVKGIGKKNDIINASDGYAKNFLLPRKVGIVADEINLSRLKKQQKLEELKKQEEIDDAKKLASELEKLNINLQVKIGENGKVFGAITNKEISLYLKEKENIEIDKKKIILSEAIKTLGTKNVEIKLHPKVIAKVKVNVSEERK